jgi:hypothetical protein
MINRSLLVVVALLVGAVELPHAQVIGIADQLAAAEAIWKRAPLNGVVMRAEGCQALRCSYSSG